LRVLKIKLMNLREKIIRASHKAKACHIGSALSCVEIIEAIAEVMNDEDVFIFAKASGVATLYCYMHGWEKAAKYLKKYPLPSKQVPGVIWSGGSLGMGLSVACGMAYSDRNRKVYCLISDGELQEGQTQEVLMFSRHHNLSNLICIVDNNGLQSLGKTKEILNPFHDIAGIDGHDKEVLKKTFKVKTNFFKFIVANTIKGKGVSFMEKDRVGYHYTNLDEHGLTQAILELNS
jgi:transketolase